MTATDTEAALLAAIRENPGEDAPRLVYADWLEENAGTVACAACDGTRLVQHRPPRGANYDAMGHIEDCPICHGTGRVSDGRAELAEFIRVQVELAKRNPRDCNQGTCRTGGRDRPCTACREREELQARERELWPAVHQHYPIGSCFENSARWTGEAGESRGHPLILIRLGLPAVVRCTLAEWMSAKPEYAECSFSGDPRTYRVVTFPGGPGIGPRLAQRWPIERVEVTPESDWMTDHGEAFGREHPDLRYAVSLPEDAREPGNPWPDRMFATIDEAREWFGDWLIAWARGQVIQEELS